MSIPRSTAFRTFSALSKARSIVRTVEPHPYERLTSGAAAKSDWGKQVKSVAGTAAVFLPSLALFLAWPVVAGKMLNGHV